MRVPPFASVEALIRADSLAQRYHCRPSTLLGVTDPYTAWCVDEACAIAAVQREMRDRPVQSAPETPPMPVRMQNTEWGGLLVGTFRRED